MSTATENLESLNLHLMGEQPVQPAANFDIAITRLAESVVGVTPLDLSAGGAADYVATPDSIRGQVVLLQGATAARSVVVEDLPFRRLFVNASNYVIALKTGTQATGVEIAALSTQECWCDGAEVKELAVSAEGNVVNGTAAGQVPAWNPATNQYEPSAALANKPPVIAGYVPGKPEASEVLFSMPVVLPQRLKAGLPGSQWKRLDAPTAAATVTLKKSSAAIGTIEYSGAGATVTFAADVDFAAGDVLDILAPSAQDATLAGLSWAILGEWI